MMFIDYDKLAKMTAIEVVKLQKTVADNVKWAEDNILNKCPHENKHQVYHKFPWCNLWRRCGMCGHIEKTITHEIVYDATYGFAKCKNCGKVWYDRNDSEPAV